MIPSAISGRSARRRSRCGAARANIEQRDPAVLAKLVYDGVRGNRLNIRDHMIRDFAAALGRDGLLALRDLFLAEYQANLTCDSVDVWQQRRPLRHLAQVADALGDVEMYIDVQRRCGAEETHALPIARRLLEAGRADEALQYLERVDPTRGYLQGEENGGALRVRILKALGRDADARDTLWQQFRRGLSETALEQLLALTPVENQQALIEQAIMVAEAHADRQAGASFLLARGHKDRAAKLIDACPEQFDGSCYGTLLPLAEAISEEYPGSAWVLYRSLLLSILTRKRPKAYHHAADYLSIMNDLAARAGLHEEQQALKAQLHAQHGRKYTFWSHVRK
jgi:hypothetical protein